MNSRWMGIIGIAAPIIACGHAPARDARGFDREAVSRELARINVVRCEPPWGLVGSSHITIVFEPDGTVSSAIVDDYDWERGMATGRAIAGTSTAECVERLFRAVRIPSFSPGPPIRVGQMIHFGTYMKGY